MKPLISKIGAVAASAALAFCPFGCSSQSTERQTPEETKPATYNVGDTGETDLVKLALNDAALAVALNNSLPVGTDFNIDNDYFCPEDRLKTQSSYQ